MEFVFTREYQSELCDVEKVFENGLQPWLNNVYSDLCKLENDNTWKNLPGLVLCIYRYVGLNQQLAIVMADIFKTAYFANVTQEWVKDVEEGQEHNREMQFRILIGDYAFGRILKLLVEAKADCLIKYFALMMAEISEGMVIKYKLNAGYHHTIRKTKAPLYATAFLTAAHLARIDEVGRELYRQMGYNIGMAMELMSNPRLRAEAQVYVHKSEEIFAQLNQNNKVLNSNLEKVIKELHGILCTEDDIAVV